MEDLAFLENASATHEDIAESGSPAMPLPFDQPNVGRAVRVDAPVFNPVTMEVLKVSNIIYEHHFDGRPPERAYWVGRKLKKCIFGVVKECTILRFRNDPEVPWEVTEHRAAGKIMSWQKIRSLQHIEDPQKEVAAMQFVSQAGNHPHVMGVLDVLKDDDYLLLFMPFCSSGDLFGFVQQAGRFPEPMARYWFKQILEVSLALSFLRSNGHDGAVKVALSHFTNNRRAYRIFREWEYVIATCPWRIYWWTGILGRWLSIWACV
jgi:serine/threonine protein kinase